MDLELLGWPAEGPTLRLDHREFSYAGKFVMSNTGKAVAREDDALVAAIAFNEDRTDPDRLWLRYVTVRTDRRGEGIGPELVEFVVEAAASRGYSTVRIAVNNPFAYHALRKAGFGFTGETTGIAELVLERPTRAPTPADPERYRSGLELFADRDLSEDERAFLEAARSGESSGAVTGDRS
jgi:GNAT superfamily N-acetyltransferase